MDQQQIRRLRLRVAAKLMLVVGFVGVMYVMISMIFSSDPDSRVMPTKVVDIGNLRAGEIRIVLWEGRPVLIYHRTTAQVQALKAEDTRLLDAVSAKSRQPAWAKNEQRSSKPDYFVSIGVGTDFSCPIRLLPASAELFMAQPWAGGFVDECRGARYDFAGRVYSGQYADENLIVPRYRIENNVLVLGG